MKTCSKGNEYETYPKPTSMTISSRKQPFVVGACIGAGSFNTVYDVPTTTNVLRLTSRMNRAHPEPPEDMGKENALMRIASWGATRFHPIIYAQSQMHAPFGCTGVVSATLMQRETSLSHYLEAAEFNDVGKEKLTRLWGSLYSSLCRAADLGLCLCDIRPNNVLCNPATGVCHLIDFGFDYTIWMDERLFEMLQSGEERRYATSRTTSAPLESFRRGAACAKTRGVQLYLMLLLFHAHLTLDYKTSSRAQVFASNIETLLANSCVPLQELLELSKQEDLHPEYCSHDSEKKEGLMQVLLCRIRHYFKDKNLKWFLLDYVWKNHLISPRCTGKSLQDIVVGGKSYSQDNVSCTSNRQAVLKRIDDRTYPCLKVDNGILPDTQYVIENGEARAVIGGKSLGKGGRTMSLAQRIRGVPLVLPSIALEYTDSRPECPR